jgi:hypothetical protein
MRVDLRYSSSICEHVSSYNYMDTVHGPDLLKNTLGPVMAVNHSHLERDATAMSWNGPLPLFAQFPDQNRENAAVVGYAEMYLLAQAALFGVCQRNAAFLRYFSEKDAEPVRKVFQYLLGPMGTGTREVADVSWPLSILYGNQPSGGDRTNPCQVNPTFTAWMVNDRVDGRGPMIILCPRLFTLSPRPLLEWDCDHLPAYADIDIQTVGSVLLHEFTHWNILTLKASSLKVVDYGFGLNAMGVSNDGNPPHGYGPYNAMVLNQKANGVFKQPTLNADSYAWFALESYWSLKCKRDFKDPRPSANDQKPYDGITNFKDMAGTVNPLAAPPPNPP